MSSWSSASPLFGAVGRRAAVLRAEDVSTVAPLGMGRDLTQAAAQPIAQEPVQTVEEALVDGYTDGHRDGYRDGLRAGTEQARAAAAMAERDRATVVVAALAALDRAAVTLTARQALTVTEVEDLIAAAAFELAEAVLGRELALAAAPGRAAVARALALAPEGVPVTLRLNPDDVEVLAELGVELAPGCDYTLVADPAVEQAGCVLEAGPTRVDAQISSALERARLALLGEGPAPGREAGGAPGAAGGGQKS